MRGWKAHPFPAKRRYIWGKSLRRSGQDVPGFPKRCWPRGRGVMILPGAFPRGEHPRGACISFRGIRNPTVGACVAGVGDPRFACYRDYKLEKLQAALGRASGFFPSMPALSVERCPSSFAQDVPHGWPRPSVSHSQNAPYRVSLGDTVFVTWTKSALCCTGPPQA